MSRIQIAGLIVGGIFIFGLVVWITRTVTRSNALSRCEDLKRQRAALAVQGGDVVAIARLDAEIRQCAQSAQALGADVDLGGVTLDGCVAKAEQIEQEWAHYRSTEYTDAIKRNNTRGTMLRLGEEMARCFEQAVAEAETPESIERIRTALSRAIGKAEDRERCYRNDGSGCGRFGLNEAHGNDKASDEINRVITPLRAAHAAASRKRDEIRRAAPGVTA